MRTVLEILLIPISLIALYALFVGLTFGFNLWNPNAPLVTAIWLGIVTSPAWFYGLLRWSKGSRPRTAILFAASIGAILLGTAYFLTH